jgi:tetratricopeptide (TPR) repeat protein
MTRTTLRLATLAIAASVAFAFSPLPAFADGGGGGGGGGGSEPPPPATDSKSKSKKRSDRQFIDGYKAAYVTIYRQHDYTSAIAQLKALKRPHHPDVANLIGYANRKLGNYAESKAWYETALKTDPSHVRTWQYYGLWQLEQGNSAQAQVHLDRIASLCGISCAEYRSLSEAMGKVATGGRLVY